MLQCGGGGPRYASSCEQLRVACGGVGDEGEEAHHEVAVRRLYKPLELVRSGELFRGRVEKVDGETVAGSSGDGRDTRRGK